MEFVSDKPLQVRVARGEFGEAGSSPLGFFPAPGNNCWPAFLMSWCRARYIKPTEDDLVLSVRVKKGQLEDFLDFVYAGDASYFDPSKMLTWNGHAYLANNLNDLRAFVAQQLTHVSGTS